MTPHPITVTIRSFGYHRSGMPPADAIDGGGAVFDCRLLPNPGRDAAWSGTTGLNPRLAEHLDAMPAAVTFMQHVLGIVDAALAEYIRRGFPRLAIDFGCTGGQHRSVWCAERLAAHLVRKGVGVRIDHLERRSWP